MGEEQLWTRVFDEFFNLPDVLSERFERLSDTFQLSTEAVESIQSLLASEYAFSRFAKLFPYGSSEVRVRVLQTLGNCLRWVHTSQAVFWSLSLSEWEAFLVLLQASTALEEVSFDYSEDEFDDMELSRIGQLWADVLRAVQSVRKIQFTACLSGSFAAGLTLRLSDYTLPSLTDLTVDFIPDSLTAVHVARVIHCSSQLRNLDLGGVCTLKEDAIQAWSESLSVAKHLQTVTIQAVQGGVGISKALAKGFSISSSKPPLQRLFINGYFRASEREILLPHLIAASITQIEVGPRIIQSLSPDGWRKVGAALLEATVLGSLKLVVTPVFYYDTDFMGRKWKDVLESIFILWQTSRQSSLIEVSLHFSLDPNDIACFIESSKYPFSTGTVLQLGPHGNFGPLEDAAEDFKCALGNGESLGKSITIVDAEVSSEVFWKYLFASLRGNTTTTHLSLKRCRSLTEDAFRALMGLLQVNLTLQNVDLEETPWMEDGKAALVKEALERNAKQEGYFSVMRQAKLTFHGAKSGRIFLCGSPFAGKTRLKLTMMDARSKRNKAGSVLTNTIKKGKNLLEGAVRSRTRGIEVDWLSGDDEKKKMSVWDLAGQHVFRVLHELLFPKTSQACAFVFVYSPFDRSGKKLVPKSNPVDAFSEDLKQWLRFIVSNTRVTGRILPQMLVVITHKDYVQQTKKFNVSFELEDYAYVVRTLRSKFKDVVDLCPAPSSEIYFINAKSLEDVKPVTDSILQWMDTLLDTKTPIVPKVCSDMISLLAKRPQEILVSPVRRASSWYEYCCEASPSLEQFKLTDPWGKQVLYAVASCMHDAGSIIIVPSLLAGGAQENSDEDLVILDPNWLTQNFLGEIICLGHCPEKGRLPTTAHAVQDGIASIDYLRALVKEILSSKVNVGKKLDADIVLDLLTGLDLCHKLELGEGQQMYFMPMIVGKEEERVLQGKSTEHVLAWSPVIEPTTSTTPEFFGFRVQCHDSERTRFGFALYPRFQMYLRRTLNQRLGEYQHTFKFVRDCLEIEADGHQIFVENDGSAGNHVDFLVRCSRHKSLGMAKRFVRKYLLDEFIAFCASSKGCQGLRLVVSIIRADCVRLLVPRELRDKSQSLLLSTLKQTFQAYIMDRLEEGGVDEDTLFSYEHQWPSIPGYLPSKPELARNLLEVKDIQDIIVVIRKEHIQLCHKLQKLQRVSTLLSESPNVREFETMQPLQTSSSSAQSTYSSSMNPTQDPIRTVHISEDANDETFSGAKLLSRIDHLESILKRVSHDIDQGFKQLRAGVDEGFMQLRIELKDFKPIMEHTMSMMATVMSQVDQTFGYTKSMQNHKIPCRPYFTLKDVSIAQQLNAYTHAGKAVCLHFMCESRHGPHLVESQPGVILVVEKRGTINKFIRKISEISVGIISLLLEVGVQLTTGVGSIVPEIFNLATSSTVSVRNLASVVNNADPDDPKSLEEAWWYLGDYLRDISKVPLDKYSEEFKLHPVRYKEGVDPFAWLCDSCLWSAKRDGMLE